MFEYPKSFKESKLELYSLLDDLSKKGYIIDKHKEYIDNDYYIEKITISPKSRIINRLVLSSGIHGIEGYIGHVCQMYFLQEMLPLIEKHTQVIMYHIINPFGMINNRRFNHNNIDLNRNYSNTGFTLKNPDFIKVQSLLIPKKSKSIIRFNLWFYYTVITNILKHGIRSMNNAVLKGQKIDPTSIYYSGKEYEQSTDYILKELDHIYAYVDHVVWIDLHSGYGKKHSMSIINSRYEVKTTTELKKDLRYPDIIGFEHDAMYDTDGDITEKLYHVHKEKNFHSDLLALCFEFGTIGFGLINELKSFKTILLENNIYHIPHSQRMITYKNKLMKKLFAPDHPKWKQVQIKNFHKAILEILTYKKLIK